MAGTVVFLLALGGCAGDGASKVRFRIATPTVLFDAPLGVTITGVPSGERVTISASATDTAGHTWKSSATFEPDAAGEVDLARQGPVAGDYTGVHDTGLLWSMTGPDVSYARPSSNQMAVDLAASVGGRRVATGAVVRQLRAPGVSERATSVAQEGFDGALFLPADATATTPRPAVLAFGGSEGGTDSGIRTAEALASKGFPALGIGYFDGPGLPDHLTSIPLEYFATALRWLARQPGVDPHHVTVYGVSRGSEAALLLAVNFPELVSGVFAGSPSSVVNPGLPGATEPGHPPAWTLHGRPIPGVGDAELGDPQPAGNPAAIIPVERIRGSVFLLCGGNDGLWPSCRYTDAIAARLGAHPHAVLHEPDAGHLVGSPIANRIVSPDGRDGGTQQADALGRLDAWPKLLAFLAAQPKP
ncbi:acyl-CoA thioesterase/BAAT N-terminal domain-containing protein [Krasilnikovia sp. MM14-A1259]|uniref:acyl-CoA thioesterase/BAAT N-terminal domain-containing protein n=1 Tax=Krasilnikovia sp. MM14-A1259 TaxID=3373539 RepID=UPI00399C72C5